MTTKVSDQLTKHFKRAEFACKCGCGFGLAEGDIDPRLVASLQQLRDYFQVPVKITSGCRCVRHNAAIGGARNSQHTKGKAADVKVFGHTPDEVVAVVEKYIPRFKGIGIYPTWVHLDVRTGTPWRKDYRK